MEPSLLIASPQMKDAFFERAVVLLWHHDQNGAIGVVINRAMEHSIVDILQMPNEVDTSIYIDEAVSWGGPVESKSGTVIAQTEIDPEEGWNLPTGLCITRSQEALEQLLLQGHKIVVCLGYAGWGPGQLDLELEAGGWLCTDLDPAIVFETPIDKRYDRALANLGLTSQTVWMTPINE